MTVSDIPFIVVFLFVVGISIVIATYLKNEIMPEIKSMVGSDATATINTVEVAFNGLDYVFFFITIGLGIGSIILAYFIDVHPLFFFVSLISFILVRPFSFVPKEVLFLRYLRCLR